MEHSGRIILSKILKRYGPYVSVVKVSYWHCSIISFSWTLGLCGRLRESIYVSMTKDVTRLSSRVLAPACWIHLSQF